jgi:hypothetical protein
VRHTNLIERTFGETRRRVKVIGRLPGENTCLTLVWAVLDRASAGWNGVATTPSATAHLTRLRADLYDPPTPGRTGTGTGGHAAQPWQTLKGRTQPRAAARQGIRCSTRVQCNPPYEPNDLSP